MVRSVVVVIFAAVVRTQHAARFMDRSTAERSSAKVLWERAVNEVKETPRWHNLEWSRLPSYLQNEFQVEAQKRWQQLLEERHRQKMMEQEQREGAAQQLSTDQAADDPGESNAMQRLLAGVDRPAIASPLYAVKKSGCRALCNQYDHNHNNYH